MKSLLILALTIASISSSAETLDDFTGEFSLLKTNRNSKIECEESLIIVNNDGVGILANDVDFTLGKQVIDKKRFVISSKFNNTFTRKRYKKTFFNRSGKYQGSHYIALLDGEGFVGPVGTDLFFEYSDQDGIQSECYYDRIEE